jgi:hypothetical protein
MEAFFESEESHPEEIHTEQNMRGSIADDLRQAVFDAVEEKKRNLSNMAADDHKLVGTYQYYGQDMETDADDFRPLRPHATKEGHWWVRHKLAATVMTVGMVAAFGASLRQVPKHKKK